MAVPSRAFLKASLALWKRREKYRKSRHDVWEHRVEAARKKDQHPRQGLIDTRNHWTARLKQARMMIALRENQLGLAGHALGVDVSNNNGTVDWNRIEASGHRFAWCKATEGTGFTDKFFQGNVKAARAQGVKVGAYHFLTSASPSTQAKFFAAHVRAAGLGKGDLLPVVDVEQKGVTTSMAGAFVAALEKELGVKPLIYTYPSFADWTSSFGCKLWIAHYGVKHPTLPAAWSSYAAWQYSSTASVPGIRGNADVNTTDSLEGLLWT
jgi:lysozyme